MPNPIRGEVAVELPDGQRLVLVLDMEALIEAEGAYHAPLKQLMQDAAAGFVGAARALFYGALRAHQPRMLLEDATAIFVEHIDLISERLAEAAELAMPDAADDPPKANGKAVKRKSAGGKARPPGGRSGGNGAARGLIQGNSGA